MISKNDRYMLTYDSACPETSQKVMLMDDVWGVSHHIKRHLLANHVVLQLRQQSKSQPDAPARMPIEPSEHRKKVRRICQLLDMNTLLLSTLTCANSAKARHDDPDVNTTSNKSNRKIGDMLFDATDTGSCLMRGHKNDSHNASRAKTEDRRSRR